MTIPADLFEAACAARANAHSRYSGFRVGAAIRLASGEVFGGCNVENASYGATICAERGAIMSAVAACGAIEIAEVLVLSEANPPWPPCGMCRQVIAEFAAPECVVWCVNDSGEGSKRPFAEFFPQSFDASAL
ncbi:MAG: cytidine deaminase [Armatimonadetes bacterium]|nr:cytidine deaminase [Armatimonadota bacterium]